LGDKEKQLALSEAETLRRVSHANIIRYVESFMDTRLLYIVMEYADFGDLATQIKLRRETQGSFSEKEIMHIHLQLALALTHIHRLKILHRDLKPLNIFLTRRWIVKLGDFGISKVLESTTAGAQTTIGTPLYLAPEICSGEAYGTKSDLWSLGVVTYEMAALQVPFQAASMVALIMKVCSAEPAPLSPSFSRSFLDIVFGLLSKDPRLRLRLEQILGMSFTRHHMQSLLDHSRELEGESSPEAPDIIRTQKATHPLAPSPCSPAQDTAEAVRAEFFRNREVARLAKERCRGDALLRAPTAPPEIERRVERPEPRPRAGSSTPDHREAVRRRAEEEKEAKQAARMQELEEARRQAYQDRLEAKQRMEQGRRSQLGAGRGLRSSADMPPPDSPETPLPDSPESQKLDSPEVPRPRRNDCLELRHVLEAALEALPEEQTILMDAAVLMDATILADEKELERTLLPEPLEPGSGTPVTPVVPASASTSSATSAGSLAASPKTPARSQADERPIRPATAAQLSALLEGTQDSLTYSEPYSQQSSLPSTLRNCLDAAEAKEVRETQSRSEALPQAASVITLHMDAASAPEKRAGPGDTEDKASTGRCCDIM